MSVNFADLGIEQNLVETLSTLNIVTPTPVQEKSIPHVLEGKNLLAAAQTGTGKTAAFGLPIIQSVQQEKLNGTPKALILVPTRELAQQVFESLSQYASQTALRIVCVYGGISIGVQKKKLEDGADILIATPGRLLDHLFNGNVNISKTNTLVLDEADRMLDMGFWPDLQRILRRLPDEKQIMLFSATFEKRIKTIAYKLMDSPVEIEVTPPNTTAETVTQIVYPVDKKRKRELLAYLIGSKNWQQVLVFTKTKQGSDELAKELKLDGIKAVSINGDKSQGARQRALDEFKQGKVRALIATDVAARGLDIQELEQVINFDMPFKAEDYVHRIGRTGRAGNSGLAVSLMSRDEEYLLHAIENLLDQRLPQEWLAGFEPSLIEEVEPERHGGGGRKSRSAEKRKLKAKLAIHKNRGKNRR
ncbi:DEAD/DEAH box helicase [Vibrio natriegens]|uniref:DEAD/DEAH box helicase n=1 Tax=Vibrio natriegens NBRC 15636 = ATCC 14048 = DSM 759 TaxID=1219067 RepID=A0AAN0Y5U7_VIBNA|nr:DEAD/DEAH box helicase [Vibrio natriegens]ALR18371.1 DEAD/DEAH box helicase [Vibrio natriegens NBRC 15636 = ATCC 14048 = DSM 759]ANQ14319.1 DEAD/DEAH box helicase [Vibrio natriegens NBRC 15636 = ATCC 14048 = DSM 759]EPM40360.1 DEAD/DEAH box helicase [Vibrio natriegens NBRC 15636 = ATCC 14048 = DSM 759]MDX6028741.1 DEAD/DEAH box helicase [Vibrio natriegens NBRC 15636 = ATCC 14048 = DSM 759]UUI14543.1 DEAD/DEAH box helicase [Vibrio natriegens]